MQITTIGFDLAKNGIDAAEKVVVRKQLRRSQVLAFFEVADGAADGDRGNVNLTPL
jgi:hypothetical protein